MNIFVVRNQSSTAEKSGLHIHGVPNMHQLWNELSKKQYIQAPFPLYWLILAICQWKCWCP